MRITVWTWKDEKWSADKKALDNINKMIKNNEKAQSSNFIEKIVSSSLYAVGWIFFNTFSFLSWLFSKLKLKK